MGKHIIDGSRTRSDRTRLERFSALDHERSGKPGRQSEALRREPRNRNEGGKLRRYVEIDRRED